MSPNGRFAKELARAGYGIDDLPEWFGSTYRQIATAVEQPEKNGDADAKDDETRQKTADLGDSVAGNAVQPKQEPPKEQDISGVGDSLISGTQRTRRGDSSDASISAEDSALLASSGITYNAGNARCV